MAELSVLPRFFFSVFLFLHLALAKKCIKLDTCSCVMDDGSGIVTLHELDNKSGVPKSEFTKIPQSGSGSFVFSWNPCTTISSIAACKDSNSCQVNIDGEYGNYPAGSSNTTFTMDSDGNPVITYGGMITGGHSRSSIITLACDKTQKVGDFGQGFNENNPDKSTSQYTATLKSRCACPGECSFCKE
ncbi:hypothetical protein AC249_AIPGENE6917 [Exaiptasia diaphana]|nr:hypothetical protein AC249_AIPGENE6917 [Exaiptasia diaphana]